MTQLDAMEPGGIAMMAVMMLVWVLVIGAVIWLVWRAIRGQSGGGGSSSPETAEGILERRYARGDIDRATYRRMRDDLAHRPPPSS